MTAARNIVLVGAGVVGRAILRSHLDAGTSVTLIDSEPAPIARAIDESKQLPFNARLSQNFEPFHAVSFSPHNVSPHNANDPEPTGQPPTLLIESIVERLDVKRDFYTWASSRFGPTAILCSNTSTLRIAALSETVPRPERVCGMHFFMPVYNRFAVEIIRSPLTDQDTLDAVAKHARQLKKKPLIVQDAPGFVVNRMLAPYLNIAMALLCNGVDAERIEGAAMRYGMPMSPLELIDWIGARTTFDAGRVYWQAYPSRISPSPLVGALLKIKRLGRAAGCGIYDYCEQQRAPDIAPDVLQRARCYQQQPIAATDDDLTNLLAFPMWIESRRILDEGVVDDVEAIETAMAGGLGYEPQGHWHDFFHKTRLAQAKKLAAASGTLFPELLDRR